MDAGEEIRPSYLPIWFYDATASHGVEKDVMKDESFSQPLGHTRKSI